MFLDDRKGEMSTGSRRGDHLIKVLANTGMDFDIATRIEELEVGEE